MFPRLNRSERRSLRVATLLVLIGSGVRLAIDPEAAEVTWMPAASSDPTPTLAETRQAVADGLAARAVAESPLGPGERIDPNTAPAEQLERLPGIGPAKSFAIVEERDRHGPYRTPEDLARVPGIGPSLVARLAPYLTLRRSPVSAGGPTDTPQPVDINRADRSQLLALPGIGPARADSILAYRERQGGFGRLEQLLEVPGIGAAVLRGLQGRAVIR
ncbi:MAG: ComEA family DNA-binding protein [Gemmatimonadota bacterium]|jgi:competence ComEA-like helix-hairpin-helix protein|nr:MAG: ComEA family DNA-binding protein [Gemmatimonadota bacterium]